MLQLISYYCVQELVSAVNDITEETVAEEIILIFDALEHEVSQVIISRHFTYIFFQSLVKVVHTAVTLETVKEVIDDVINSSCKEVARQVVLDKVNERDQQERERLVNQFISFN